MAALDPLRDELVVTRVRAARAELALSALRIDRGVSDSVIDARDVEIARLRDIAARQQDQIATLTERVRAAETAARHMTLDALVRSLEQAIEAGEGALEDRVIVSARAEVKAALQASGGGAGLVLEVPGTFDPGALSTVSFDLLRLPPSAATQARAAALADIVRAVDELQSAFDGDGEPDPACVAVIATFAAQPPTSLETTPAALAALVRALERLAGRRLGLQGAVATLAEAVAALAAAPRPDVALHCRDALRQLVRELGQSVA